jgi:hypothetical protein
VQGLLNVGRILESDPHVRLVQKGNFVGWVYRIDYDRALVMTNDLWKAQVLGIPHNSFLLAASFNPDHFDQAPENDREVILLRVVKSSPLPQDDVMLNALIDHYQDQDSVFGGRVLDDITKSQLQFGGLECKVLGTFYAVEGQLRLGSDLESFYMAARLAAYRPRGEALSTIANYIDPDRLRRAHEEARLLGIANPVLPFEIGTVRYTSTDRMHRGRQEELVRVSIQPSDFLARRTAVLGMTRTGKSNMIKQLVSVVKRVADDGQVRIGQLIYDMNGEYANANQQDQGALADVYPGETVRYRMLPAPGFEVLGTNFYEQMEEGFSIACRELEKTGRLTSDYLQKFAKVSLDRPDDSGEVGEMKRWQRKAAAYKALLFRAGFQPPSVTYRVKFDARAEIKEAVRVTAGQEFPDPKTSGLTLQQAVDWFSALRAANKPTPLESTSGKQWVDEDLACLLNMLVRKGDNDTYISGYTVLARAMDYHTHHRSKKVGEEIYEHLTAGKIVVLDLSVGQPEVREQIAKDIASWVFNASMGVFVRGEVPPNICIYIEEAHNLIGKHLKLTEAWPRLAKEGAKYRIALVYATQEVSSVHPNILANTENWFVTHLNNEKEVGELAKFYDFEDFSRSLIRAQDVGFARVKTLSGPFVVPVQIDKFDPEAARQRVASSKSRGN